MPCDRKSQGGSPGVQVQEKLQRVFRMLDIQAWRPGVAVFKPWNRYTGYIYIYILLRLQQLMRPVKWLDQHFNIYDLQKVIFQMKMLWASCVYGEIQDVQVPALTAK